MTETPSLTDYAIPIEEFMARVKDERVEYIHGEWIENMPTTLLHAFIIKRLMAVLQKFEDAGRGIVFQEATFILEEKSRWVKGSRIPDIMFYTPERTAGLTASPNWEEFPSTVVPNLVIEVVSPTDSYSDVVQKAHLYLEDGVELVWIVEPKAQRVTTFAQGQAGSSYLEKDATLTGGDVLPEFSMPLQDLFKAI